MNKTVVVLNTTESYTFWIWWRQLVFRKDFWNFLTLSRDWPIICPVCTASLNKLKGNKAFVILKSPKHNFLQFLQLSSQPVGTASRLTWIVVKFLFPRLDGRSSTIVYQKHPVQKFFRKIQIFARKKLIICIVQWM